ALPPARRRDGNNYTGNEGTRERANRERGDEDCGTKRAAEEIRVIPSPFVPLPPGRGERGWRPSAPHIRCGLVKGCSRSAVSGRAARLLTASPHRPTRPDSPGSTWPRR